MNFNKVLQDVITENEVGGNADLIYCFSDPDGVRTGRSGWSFGRCQFDLQHNRLGMHILGNCGFSLAEVNGLVNQTYSSQEMAQFNKRLLQHATVVDAADTAEFEEIIKHVRAVIVAEGVNLEGGEAFLHLCDYHNQFYLSYGGKCVRYMQDLSREITAQDILDCKMTTLWGRKRPDDVQRRFDNVARIFADHHSQVDEIRDNHIRSEG